MALPLEQTLLPRLIRIHDTIYKKTNGWIGHRALGIPSLLLHTVGAKTGQARAASLTYARDGDDYLIVASKGGDPKAPGWYHNLKANPNVEINVGPKRFPVTATSGAAQRPRLRAAVGDRQQKQQQPLQRLPGENVATHPGRRAHPDPLTRLARAERETAAGFSDFFRNGFTLGDKPGLKQLFGQ